MAKYDPEIIEEYASRLYKKAKEIVVTMVVVCAMFGGVGFALLGAIVSAGVGALLFLVGAGAGIAIGYAWGREMAFEYKLKAQTALCQARIEANTRSWPANSGGAV